MNPKAFLIASLLCSVAEVWSMSCRNEDNQYVDWFVIQKLPRLEDSSNDMTDGTSYVYLDSNDPEWKKGKSKITDESNPLGNTLSTLYSQSKDAAYIIFNDEKPDGDWTLSHGHTKGFLAANDKTGFYVTHSIPKFPPSVSEGYGYPHSGEKYGQDAMCISIKSDQVDIIGGQLRINEPWVYDHSMPSALRDKYPNLFKAMEQIDPQIDSNMTSFDSANGTTFTNFAKSGDYGKDLYASLVAQNLETDIATETWWSHYHTGKLGPSCDKKYQVYNVENLNYDVVDVSYSNSGDHSKFVVSTNSKKPWVCIGDINRARSQFKRGGGTTCIKNKSLWEAYDKVVTKTDQCNSRQ